MSQPKTKYANYGWHKLTIDSPTRDSQTYHPSPSPKQLCWRSEEAILVSQKKTPQETTYLIGNRDSMMLLNMAETETDRVAVRCDSVDIISAQADIQTTIETKSELRTILGYPCHGYLVTMIENGDTYTEEIWATDYIGGKDVNFFLYPDVHGVILYSRRTMQEQTVEMKAVKVTNRTAINAGSFSVPMDFSVEPCGN